MTKPARQLLQEVTKGQKPAEKKFDIEDKLIFECLNTKTPASLMKEHVTLIEDSLHHLLSDRAFSLKRLLSIPRKSIIALLLLLNYYLEQRTRKRDIKKSLERSLGVFKLIVCGYLNRATGNDLSAMDTGFETGSENDVKLELFRGEMPTALDPLGKFSGNEEGQSAEDSLITLRLLLKLIKELCMTKSGILLIKQHGFLEVLLDMLHDCDSFALHFALEALVAVIRSGMFSNVVVSSDTLNSLCYLTMSQRDAKRTMALYILQYVLKSEGIPKCPHDMTNHLPCLLSLVVEPSIHKNSAPLDNRDSTTGANNTKAKSHIPTDLYTLAQAVCRPSPEMIFDLAPVTICAASCLASLASTSDTAALMRTNGGIPVLVSCLRNIELLQPILNRREYQWNPIDVLDIDVRHQLELLTEVCKTLRHLAQDDYVAQSLVRENVIYLLGLLLLLRPKQAAVGPRQPIPHVIITLTKAEDSLMQNQCDGVVVSDVSLDKLSALEQLRVEIFQILRRFFMFERNRRLIRNLLPASILSLLMELSPRNQASEFRKYILNRLTKSWANLMEEERIHVVNSLITCDLTRPPTRWIRDYALIELLGSGAFGQVYRARKQTPTQRFYAVKEINITQAMFGHTVQERDQNLGRILNEVNIIRHQMRHPNIVRYYKTFIHEGKLYIVMEMLEGLSLTDLIISMKDKQEHFEESRVWHIFIQLIVALRYLHREKCILHRDLSSNNIMVDEGDKVTITDFGLARQKQWDSSKMLSTVGTLVYSCPEIVQNIPYGEGVDIWALGCILYQICTYSPPFQAECILTVASRIVKGEYVPVGVVSPGRYSEQIDKVISVCLTPDPTNRPDVVGVASYLTDPLLVELDATLVTAAQAKRRLKELRDHFDPSSSLLSTERIFPSRATSADQLAYGKRHDQLQSPKHTSSTDRTELGTYFVKKHPTIQISQTKLRPLDDPILALVTVVQRFERLHQTPFVRNKHHQILRQLIDSYRVRLFSEDTSPLTIKHELLQLAKRSPSPVHCALLPSNLELETHGILASRPRLEEALETLTGEMTLSDSEAVTHELIMACIDALLKVNQQSWTRK